MTSGRQRQLETPLNVPLASEICEEVAQIERREYRTGRRDGLHDVTVEVWKEVKVTLLRPGSARQMLLELEGFLTRQDQGWATSEGTCRGV